MAYEIERKRLNCMNAFIKYYDDGSEVLQSYSTDVVRKNPDGAYIRLWKSWSPTTAKQVKTWCGHSLRDLPFEDGTYEDYKKHAGYKFVDKNDRYLPRYCGLTTAEIEESVAEIKYTLKQKRMRWLVQFAYNSACNKQLLKTCSSQEERILFEVLYRCATKKPGKSATGVFCKMHDFDIQQIWDNLLIKDWGKLENQ